MTQGERGAGQGVEHHVLFVFLDGVGLASAGPSNPLSQVSMPHLQDLLGGPLLLDRSVAHVSRLYNLVLYGTFLPDLAGHRRLEPDWVLARLDAFLGSVLAHRPAETTLVVCSDHGNLKNTATKLHTTNTVPLLVVGPAAEYFSGSRSITDVAPARLQALGGCDVAQALQPVQDSAVAVHVP